MIKLLTVAVAFAVLNLPSLAAATCFESAVLRYVPQVDPVLLRAMAKVESNNRPDAVGPPLSKGDRAIGLMQINTIHLPDLKRYGITRKDLFDGCTSANLGAWVFADCIRRFGATWKAVGCYNTGPASKNLKAQVRYVTKVRRHYDKLKHRSGQPKQNRVVPEAIGRQTVSMVQW